MILHGRHKLKPDTIKYQYTSQSERPFTFEFADIIIISYFYHELK